ncbi:hypothetical protein C818_01906 [Lachnospiraceae bacterium MD308]|nr:hypothetical protein C818_01906 [Lachnospiraceae bacterium MD308]
MSFNAEVGKQIRMYRKKRGFSIEELADRIYKSKSVISKYELGQSNIDIATLYEISRALSVDVRNLLMYQDIDSKNESNHRFGIFQEDRLYLYLAERHKKKTTLHRGLIAIFAEENGDSQLTATLYLGLERNFAFEKCKSVYHGHLDCTPYNASFYLTNPLEPSEHVGIFSRISSGNRSLALGLYVSYEILSNTPIATNVIISLRPLAETDLLVSSLITEREEFSILKAGNVFRGKEFVDESDLVR